MQAIRQTLDFPLEVLHGITRDLLLAAHGTRLRQITWAMGKRHALREIERMTQPEAIRQQPEQRPPQRRRRLWMWLFSGVGASE